MTATGKKHISIRTLSAIAMMAATLAIMAQIIIPIGMIPVTLQTAGLMMTALLFKPRDAFLTLLVYLLLGMTGLPVFSAGRGGLGMIVGPTGGFLLGFVAGAFLGSLYYHRVGEKKTIHAFAAAGITLFVPYVWEIFHFMLVMHVGLNESLAAVLLPFIPFEAAKMAIFVPAARKIGSALHQQFPDTF